jgi:hypothetical protein
MVHILPRRRGDQDLELVALEGIALAIFEEIDEGGLAGSGLSHDKNP